MIETLVYSISIKKPLKTENDTQLYEEESKMKRWTLTRIFQAETRVRAVIVRKSYQAEGAEEIRKAAMDSYTAMSGAAKKRRAALFDALMA